MLLSSPLFPLVLLVVEPVTAIWPIPKTFNTGKTSLFISQTIPISYNGVPVCWTNPDFPCTPEFLDTENHLLSQLVYVYDYPVRDVTNSKEVVQGAVSRAMSSIFQDNYVPWKLHSKNKLSSFEPDPHTNLKWVKSLTITQTGKDSLKTFKPLAGDVDESYNLTMSEDGAIKIAAVSSIGVLRGLETFSQLFFKHSYGTFWYTPYAPVSIQDSPDYPHRGLLMDLARNWYDLQDIYRMIDALSWNKMNRLHLHMTDSQSWPLDIPSMPEVARKGAYMADLIYDAEDVQDIQEYGLVRGVEVVIEIDMPGHIGSLSWSHPELIVAYDAFPYNWWCAEPPCGAFKLNDSRVDAFLEKMFDDLLPRIAPYSAYFHTGGDELNANDSMLDPNIRNNSTEVLRPLLQKFIDAQHNRVRKHGLTPMVWEEIPLDWAVKLGSDAVVQTRLGSQSVLNVTGMGNKVIDSDYNYWVSVIASHTSWFQSPN